MDSDNQPSNSPNLAMCCTTGPDTSQPELSPSHHLQVRVEPATTAGAFKFREQMQTSSSITCYVTEDLDDEYEENVERRAECPVDSQPSCPGQNIPPRVEVHRSARFRLCLLLTNVHASGVFLAKICGSWFDDPPPDYDSNNWTLVKSSADIPLRSQASKVRVFIECELSLWKLDEPYQVSSALGKRMQLLAPNNLSGAPSLDIDHSMVNRHLETPKYAVNKDPQYGSHYKHGDLVTLSITVREQIGGEWYACTSPSVQSTLNETDPNRTRTVVASKPNLIHPNPTETMVASRPKLILQHDDNPRNNIAQMLSDSESAQTDSLSSGH